MVLTVQSFLRHLEKYPALLAALTPRCSMCRSTKIRPARYRSRRLFTHLCVCCSCGIRFPLSSFQVALLKPTSESDGHRGSAAEIAEPAWSFLEEAVPRKRHHGSLDISENMRKVTANPAFALPSETPSTAIERLTSANSSMKECSELLSEISVTLAKTMRSRFQQLEAKTRPT